MTVHTEIRSGVYHDSVTLLVVSRDVRATEGVSDALVAMATELNLDVLDDLGFDRTTVADATPNDLIIALRADDDAGVASALAAVERSLAASSKGSVSAGGFATPPSRTLGAAARRGEVNLALISVPGDNAFTEAMDALRAGLHVMIFSDNVSVAHEVALKDEARRRGLLVMGPDCGTAVVGGVGLGFANVVRPGPVGIVAASGTGAQQLCCLLAVADVGVTHVLGVGGRDLSAEVGGAATLDALAALDRDPATELIVILSKPPDPDVADRVRKVAAALSTPTVVGFVGQGERDLTAIADAVIEELGPAARSERPARPVWDPEPSAIASSQVTTAMSTAWIRGLFSGGTLCDEAMVIVSEALDQPVHSNIPLDPVWTLDDDHDAEGHLMIDLGEDEMTRGRPHPMIDHSLRVARIEREAAAGHDIVLLLDVVLGHGADDDPAAVLAPAVAAAHLTAAEHGSRLATVVSLCGTPDDPQGLHRQAQAFADAGATVHLSNADAARAAVKMIRGATR